MLNIPQVDKDSIDYAFKRLLAFIAVNANKEVTDQVDGLKAYCESVGLNDDASDYLFEECEGKFHDAGSVFVGILLGLAVSEHISDK